MWAMLLASECELERALTWLATHGDDGLKHGTSQDFQRTYYYYSRILLHIWTLIFYLILQFECYFFSLFQEYSKIEGKFDKVLMSNSTKPSKNIPKPVSI